MAKGLSFSKHAGAVGAFNQHRVVEYEFNLPIARGTAEEEVQMAELILRAIREHTV